MTLVTGSISNVVCTAYFIAEGIRIAVRLLIILKAMYGLSCWAERARHARMMWY